MASSQAMTSASIYTRSNTHNINSNYSVRSTAMRACRLSSTSSSFAANFSSQLQIKNSISHSTGRQQLRILAGNKGATGPFAPLVRVVRDVMGTKEFNQFRGKAISVHSQVIKDFCKQLGADTKQVQGLIRLAKKNGEKLGFLA